MYIVFDTRNADIMWYGSKQDCKEWIAMTNPQNRKFYIIKYADDGDVKRRG